MNLLQMLLVRGVVAMLWNQPYQHALIRWGTQLHDRFMLSSVIRQDLKDVLTALRGAGFAFEDSWFDAHLEFRFPNLGSVTADGVQLELRRALEPWNVLAEESVSGRTVRSVDSSMERVEVALRAISIRPVMLSPAMAAACRYSRPSSPAH